MGILVLVLLVAAWGLVLGPTLLRGTRELSPMDTERRFRRALRALGGPRRPRSVPFGRWVLVPSSPPYPPPPPSRPARPTAADRRRRNLTVLAGFIVVSFPLGVFVQALRFLLVANLVADVLLIAYLLAILYFSARPPAQARPEPYPLRQRPEAAGGRW